MRILYGFIIAVVLISIFVVSYKKTKDIFSPLSFFSIFQFLRYVPCFLVSNYDSKVALNNGNLFITFLMEMLFVIFVVVGYSLKKKKKKQSAIKIVLTIPFLLIITIFLFGFASRIYILQKLGGLIYVIKNMGKAYHELTEIGNGYVNNLSFLMTISIVMCIYKYSISKRRKYLFVSIAFTGLGMLTHLVYSSRSPALEMAMFALVAYHYFVKKITFKSLLKPRVILFLVFSLTIIVVLPSLRTLSSGGSSINYSDVKSSINSSNFFEDLANEFSAVGRDTFVYNYFGNNNYWLGKNYLNLFSALVPSSIYTNKPCLDDGNYLCNLIYGYQCSPNQGRNDLIVKYSMPFTSQSIAFANFGVLGVIFAGLIIGLLFKKIYGVINTHLSIATIIIYVLIVYQFDFSTLGIVQTMIPLMITLVVCFVSMAFCTKKAYLIRNKRFSV